MSAIRTTRYNKKPCTDCKYIQMISIQRVLIIECSNTEGATMKLLYRCKKLTLSQYITPELEGIALDSKGNEYYFSNDGYNSYIRLNKFGSKIQWGLVEINNSTVTFTKKIMVA